MIHRDHRFILNYKRLRYCTIWVEFPEVETTLRRLGAPPSSLKPDGRPVYTLPVIVDPTRNVNEPAILTNTSNIAEYLESNYPARPVYPPGSRALQTLFVHYIQEVFSKPLLPIMVPLSHELLHRNSRSQFAGPAPTGGPQGEHLWIAVKEQFDFLATILGKNSGDGDGVVSFGREVSYADFALCSVLIWIQRISPHDGWARVRTWNGGRWNLLWERCKPYMEEH